MKVWLKFTSLPKIASAVNFSDTKVCTYICIYNWRLQKAMTVEQIRDSENVVLDIIGRNQPIFAQETPLGLAKEIQGLRAVFDETYPDPVRVLTIGVPVEKLTEDPTGPWGIENSVELCGGTWVCVCVCVHVEAGGGEFRTKINLQCPLS